MEKTTLKAENRKVVGKKVKSLREGGILPGSIYGKSQPSINIGVNLKDFTPVFKKVGESGLVELNYEGKIYHTLIRQVAIHPVTRMPLNVQFQAVSLTEKIKTAVPVVSEGESPAVVNGIGLLLQTINEVEVEALPAQLPEHLVADISVLGEVDQQLTVADLKVTEGIEVLTPAGEVVFRVAPAVTEEAKKEAEAAAAVEAAKQAASEATATPAQQTSAPANLSESSE